jgi:hypothetical protein
MKKLGSRMRIGVRLVVSTIALVAATVVLPAEAKAPAVTIGKVTTEAASKPELQPELKTAIEKEVAQLDLSNAKQTYVLSAALVTLETVKESDRVESTCVITAELSKKGEGTIRAVLRGKAKVTDAKDAVQEAERTALRAAARSTVKRLPEAVE